MSNNKKVLVVHRQASVTNDTKKQFERVGWWVHLAHSGLDGLLTARKESFGLILSAIDLPVITGIEMVRAIRNFSVNVNTQILFCEQPVEKGYDAILKKLKVSYQSITSMDLHQFVKIFDLVKIEGNNTRLESYSSPVDNND